MSGPENESPLTKVGAGAAPGSPPASPTSIEKAAGLGILTALAGIGASIVRSKTSAVVLGPVGVGITAEIFQLVGLALVPLAVFAGPALMQGLARERANGARVTTAALSWVLLLGLALSGAVTVLSPLLLPAQWAGGKQLFVALTCISVVLAAVTGVATQTLVFVGRIATASSIALVAAVLGAVVVAALTATLGLPGQFIAIAATPALLLPWIFRKSRQAGLWPARLLTFNFDRAFLREALGVGAATLVAAMALQGALYSTRWCLELKGGPELNGQFQAAWAIGSAYLNMLLSGVGNFAFPRYAAARNATELQDEANSTAHFVVRFAVPVVLLAAVFSGLAVRVLYSARFDTAIEILRWQLAGDVAKCFSWVYAGPLLYRGRLRAYVVTESIAAVLLGGLSWLFVPISGAAGVGQAYLVTYVLYLVASAVAAKVALGIAPQLRHLGIAVGATVVLAALASVLMTPVVQSVAAVVAAAWLWKAGVFKVAQARLLARFNR